MASEDERIAELESRIERLEAQLPDGVSRRDALKLGGVGLLGALGGGGAALGATGTAEAGTYQAGSLGTPDNPLDLTVDDLSVVDSAGNETGHVDATGAQYESVAFKEALDTQVTASESTSYDIDLEAGNYHKVTLTGDVDFDFINTDSTDINSVVLHLVQDSTGGRSPTFSNPTVVGDSGFAPSWSTGANEEDIATFIFDQDGSQWILAEGPFNLGAI